MILLAMAACAFHEASLFRGRFITLRDLTSHFAPWQTYAWQCYRGGVAPLWCPYNDCGAPFLANIEPAVLYPPNAAFGWAGFGRGLTAFVLMHTILAGAFTFALLRSFGVSRLGGLMGAIAYMCGGWFETRVEFLSWLGGLTWQPAHLWFAWLAVSRRSWRWSAAWGAAAAMQLLAGYPEGLIVTSMMAGAMLIGYALSHWPALGGRGVLRIAAVGLVAISVCALVSAAQLLPTLELAPLSSRGSGHDYAASAGRSVYPLHFITWFVPRAFGGQGFHRYWGGTLQEFSFSCYYAGVLTVLLAIAAVGQLVSRGSRASQDLAGRRWLVATWLVIILAGMALAMGKFAPFHKLAFDHAPVIGRIRWPIKFMSISVMGVCVLAGLGVDALRAAGDGKRRSPRFAVGVLVIATCLLAAFSAALFRHRDPAASWAGRLVTWHAFTKQLSCFRQHHRLAAMDGARCLVLLNLSALAIYFWRRTQRRRLGAAALIATLVLDLWTTTRPINWTSEADLYGAKTPIVERIMRSQQPGRAYVPDRVLFANNGLAGLRNPEAFLWAENALLANRSAAHGIRTVHGDYPLDVARHWNLENVLESRPRHSPARSRLMNLLNVRWEIGAAGANVDSLVDMRDYARYATLLGRESKRAWVVSEVRCMDDADALPHMGSGQFDPYRVALAPEASLAASYPPWRGTLGITKLGSHETRLAVEGGPGLLVLSETFYPGWRLYDRGRRGAIPRVDYTLRGAVIERGRHDLRFVYHPASAKFGFALSLLGLAGLLAWVAARRSSIT